MRLGCKVLFVLQLALNIQVYGQQTLNGRVYESFTDSIMTGVNVFNTNTKASTRTGIDGSFKISASEGDMVIFSASGFKPDTITVSFSLMLTRFDLSLHRDVISLKAVNVTSSYSADSINRRQEYSKIYEQPGITGRNRPANGFGITLSPASFFSRESKQARVLRKRLEKEEKERYIDHYFPMPWIKTITRLEGDSLSIFMYRYRPTYDFCRKSTQQQMFFYINDKLKEFRKPKKNN